ncbi:hypothetical protein NLA06_07190 [Desulfomicrobium sp. ZS1]|uniref:hypothetical protein n=1 Tax=Desulfomicrobium sp. ZS1 TaxID=2952228 RepID=UPI0020B295DD|nr:hypothetical protein [Desulfomicrobium sp. ZS1]UTF51663.1 hypothetical protein NLA06_07190 [Desulfomicrobium sp. ZS1]
MYKYLIIIIFIFIPINVFPFEQDNQIKIKDGAEVRCMSGLVDEEFAESNYVGDYVFGTNDCVTIQDDRTQSGHLILHANCLGLHCPLYRFSKFIYVYGKYPDSPEPVLGTVTFLSDGSYVNQMILQHDSKNAFFPRKK